MPGTMAMACALGQQRPRNFVLRHLHRLREHRGRVDHGHFRGILHGSELGVVRAIRTAGRETPGLAKRQHGEMRWPLQSGPTGREGKMLAEIRAMLEFQQDNSSLANLVCRPIARVGVSIAGRPRRGQVV